MIAWRRRDHRLQSRPSGRRAKGARLMERRGRLAGKVALVTGVAKLDGIGFATARVFAEEEAAGIAVLDIAEAVHDCAAQPRPAAARPHRRPHQGRRGAEGRRRGACRARPHRRAGQQRRHGRLWSGRGFRRLPGHDRAPVGLRHRHQPEEPVPRDPRRRAAHDRAWLRAHRQRLVGDRPRGRQPAKSRCTAPPRPACWA